MTKTHHPRPWREVVRLKKAGGLDPLSLPVELQTALEALHGHYEKTFEEWRQDSMCRPASSSRITTRAPGSRTGPVPTSITSGTTFGTRHSLRKRRRVQT